MSDPIITAAHEYRYTVRGDCGHEAANIVSVGYKQVTLCGPCALVLWRTIQPLPYLRDLEPREEQAG